MLIIFKVSDHDDLIIESFHVEGIVTIASTTLVKFHIHKLFLIKKLRIIIILR